MSRTIFKVTRHGPVACAENGWSFVVKPLMTCRFYLVDGLCIDSGCAHAAETSADFIADQKPARIFLTHSHEDHSGGAKAIKERLNIELLASPETAEVVGRGFYHPFYRRLTWGTMQPVACTPYQSKILETEHYRFELHPAFGHAIGQYVLHEPKQGWLFSGDLYLSSRPKWLSTWESFEMIVEDLRRISRLDFEVLFCAHNPRFSEGQKFLIEKLSYLLELQENCRDLHRQGFEPAAIASKLLGKKSFPEYISGGEFGAKQMVLGALGLAQRT
jgi:glyoxylase-like metal-dependent hydrolase (beta-lactamase superfamily II)